MGSIGAKIQRHKNYTPIYHGTTFKNLLQILESNELRAGISNETETYGVSTTRNKDSAYGDVSIVLDKDKLHNNYKIEPIYRESVFGLDLAEERIPKTVTNVLKYIKEIRWNDTSKSNITLRILRRRLVNNFNNPEYTNTPGSDAYYIKQLAKLAAQKKIPLDSKLKEAVKYIKRFDDRIFDQKRYDEMQKQKRRKGN